MVDQTKSNYLKSRNLDCRILTPTKDLSREDWLLARKLGIGGSEIASIAGLSQYASPYSVWAEKSGLINGDFDSEIMSWGRLLEDVIAKEYSNRSGNRIENAHYIFQHKKINFFLANVDRIIFDAETGKKGILECKNSSVYMAKEWEIDSENVDKVPDIYHCQGQWYLGITGFDFVDYAVLLGGNKLIIKRHWREEDTIQKLQEVGKKFWITNVMGGNAPSIDKSMSTFETLKALYTPEIDSKINMDSIKDVFEQHKQLKDRIKLLKEELQLCKNKILSKLGNNRIGKIGEKNVVNCIPVKGKVSIDLARLKEERPDIHTKYLKIGKESSQVRITY